MLSSAFMSANDFGPFKRNVHVFPLSIQNRQDLENGDKILLPPSFLEELINREISYPMMFKLENPHNKKSIYCGVTEFSAEAGTALIPTWMMTQMALGDGDQMNIYNVTLQKGSYVLIRPHTYKFTLLPDPKGILEKALISYASLTRGTTIQISHDQVIYKFDIRDVKPARAVCIIETDLNVDFDEPRDYAEYEAILKAKQADRKIKERFQMTSSVPMFQSNSNNGHGSGDNTLTAKDFERFSLDPTSPVGMNGSASSYTKTSDPLDATNVFAFPLHTEKVNESVFSSLPGRSLGSPSSSRTMGSTTTSGISTEERRRMMAEAYSKNRNKLTPIAAPHTASTTTTTTTTITAPVAGNSLGGGTNTAGNAVASSNKQSDNDTEAARRQARLAALTSRPNKPIATTPVSTNPTISTEPTKRIEKIGKIIIEEEVRL